MVDVDENRNRQGVISKSSACRLWNERREGKSGNY